MYNTLNNLNIGKIGYIVNIDYMCNNRLRLMDLGLTSETKVIPVWQGRKIRAYLIKGTLIALREKEARLINVITE